jgi:hypothetical protein
VVLLARLVVMRLLGRRADARRLGRRAACRRRGRVGRRGRGSRCGSASSSTAGRCGRWWRRGWRGRRVRREGKTGAPSQCERTKRDDAHRACCLHNSPGEPWNGLAPIRTLSRGITSLTAQRKESSFLPTCPSHPSADPGRGDNP